MLAACELGLGSWLSPGYLSGLCSASCVVLVAASVVVNIILLHCGWLQHDSEDQTDCLAFKQTVCDKLPLPSQQTVLLKRRTAYPRQRRACAGHRSQSTMRRPRRPQLCAVL